MTEKRFYWLKLKENYFNSPKIKKLRKIAGGDTYTIIYLKMQLLSITNEGIIKFEKIEPTIEEELALKLDEDVENVSVTLAYLQSQGLIDTNENEYLLIEASNNIGSEGQSAERKRLFDKRKKEQPLLCNASVTQVKRNSISISNSNSSSNSNSNNIEEIIDYLNNKCNTKYKVSTKSTLQSINARLNDGYTLEDFKTVIDKKCDEWMGTEMEKYLTPDTLFRPSNFEKYLNQKIVKKSCGFETHNYSKAEINNVFNDIEDVEI